MIDPRNDPLWSSSIDEVRMISEGALGVGARIRTVAHFLGRRIETPEEVTGYEPNRSLTLEVTAGPMRFTGNRVVEGVAGGTRVTMAIEGNSGGFFGLPEPVIDRLAGRRLGADLANLKRFLEGRPLEAKARSRAASILAAGLAGATVLAMLRRRGKPRTNFGR